MNTFVRCYKNTQLSLVPAVVLGALVVSGLYGCGSSSSGGGTPEAYITRVNLNANGEQTLGSTSGKPVVTADGRYIVFESRADNLVPNDTNNSIDIFMRDTLNNTITRISVNADGEEGDANSISPAITPDGKFITFGSRGTNLVPGNEATPGDIYKYDVDNQSLELVSLSSGVKGVDAIASDGISSEPSISADGRYIAFKSFATTLVDNDLNGVIDIFVRDTLNNVTTRVSIASGVDGVEGDLSSGRAFIISDGSKVAFSSLSTNLVSNDNNNSNDVFLRDLVTNTTVLISADANGNIGNDHSTQPSISDDGTLIAFGSRASNLVENDTNGSTDIFLRNLTTNTISRVSLSTEGVEGDQTSNGGKISADGSFVVFYSSASTLVLDDTNDANDVFLRDTVANQTIRLSVNADGVEGDDSSRWPAVSANGQYVVFESDATNLVADDTNDERDIFRVLISAAP